jgi:hypothetical protein
MKRKFSALYVGLALCCAYLPATSQEFKEHVSKEFALSKDAGSTVVSVYNVDGPVRVEGYSGNKVVMEIDKTISAETNAELETGKKEFRLEFEQSADSITAYIAGPYDSRPKRHWRNRDDRNDIDYRYSLAFVIKVPFGMNLNLSTVNNGVIKVKDVAGTLHVNNINGAIDIEGAKSTTWAHTINGDLTVSYLRNPREASSFNTLNGKLTVAFQPDLSADLQFKSMNGEFFTDFPGAEALPAKAVKEQQTRNGETVYKLNKLTTVRIGAGANTLKFETLNGNIYIKKQS